MYYRAQAAALANGGAFHLAAILKRRKSIINIATNQEKTHPGSHSLKESGHVCHALHAEQAALRHSQPGDTLYVIRFRKDGTPAMAKPCINCRKWLRNKGVKTVFYTDTNGEWKKLATEE